MVASVAGWVVSVDAGVDVAVGAAQAESNSSIDTIKRILCLMLYFISKI
jgi:hypothetical protein